MELKEVDLAKKVNLEEMTKVEKFDEITLESILDRGINKEDKKRQSRYELSPYDRCVEQYKILYDFNEKAGTKIEMLEGVYGSTYRDLESGFYLYRPYSDQESYTNHVILLKYNKEKEMLKVFDTLNNSSYNQFGELKNRRLQDIFGVSNIISVDVDFKKKSDLKEEKKIAGKQGSWQGCFEMCLAIAMLYLIRKEELIKNSQELDKEKVKTESREKVITESNEFANKIRLRERGQGTKIPEVKTYVRSFYEKRAGEFKGIHSR